MVAPRHVSGWILAAAVLATAGGLSWNHRQQTTVAATIPINNGVALSTDRARYLPGEPILITLTNSGAGIVTLARDPAYFIEQGTTTIFAPVAALGQQHRPAVTLRPGETRTWIWDQFSTVGQVSLGTYTVRVPYTQNRTDSELTSELSIGSRGEL
ncbi:hypothetical protein HY524_00010 [Candidatus Berkelbacteria bacterium]|nr:hypothetical protein [Candidatus Berkelbacteria bacterium]